MTGHPIPFKVQLTPNWAITLQQQFRQRTEAETLVLLNDQLSIWIRSYGTQDGKTIEDRMARDLALAPEGAVEQHSQQEGLIGRVSYLVPAILTGDKPRPPNLYTYAHSADSQLMMSFIHKDEAGLAMARTIFASLEYTPSLG